MNSDLLIKVNNEIARGFEKWGHVDKTPQDYMIAAQEELGEIAHAINHREGVNQVRQEIAEVIGILNRLYEAY